MLTESTPCSEIAALASQHPFFAQLTSATLTRLCRELELVTLEPEQVLFSQGAAGDSMYAVLEGRLAVRRVEVNGDFTILEEAGRGATVGEMALLSGQPRAATIVAREQTRLIRLSHEGFQLAVADEPALAEELARAMLPRWQRVQLADTLNRIFPRLSHAELLELQERLQWRQFAAHEVVCEQGDPADELFIVVSGRLRYEGRSDDGRLLAEGEIGVGETVGEFALITRERRSATVIALRQTMLTVLKQQDFDDLLESHPRMMAAITRIIVRRQQLTLREARAARTNALTFALLPISPGLENSGLGRRLAEVLAVAAAAQRTDQDSTQGATLHLSSRRCDLLYGLDGASQRALDDPIGLAVNGWIGEQESRHRYVVYEADATWTPWTQRCVQQADRIILLADATADPAPGPLEVALGEVATGALRELILLHPATTTQPSRTARWLDGRDVHAHHHVRQEHRQDLERLARRLIGRATGVVFSGGAARGFVHVGVMQALEEAGVVVDMIGGTSMGAVLGAGFAGGYTYEELIELAGRVGSTRAVMDYTLPVASFAASAKITRTFQELGRGLDMEDLWRPFFTVATNLSTREPYVFRRGPFWKSVRASMALPGVFTPVTHEGHILVDGGLMNNLAVDIMRDLCQGGAVIASDANPRREWDDGIDFPDSLSGWRLLYERLAPWRPTPQVPTIVSTMMRSLGVNASYQLQQVRHLADLVISVPTAGYDMLQFDAYRELIQLGYETAKPQIAAWLQAGEAQT